MWYTQDEFAMKEPKELQQFVDRKQDHIRLALLDENEALGASLLDRFDLIHDSLPDLNLNEISIESALLDQPIKTPFFISGMTAGHEHAQSINDVLAALASERGWIMGVGSQRRELGSESGSSYRDRSIDQLTQKYPTLKLIANFGVTQLAEMDQAQSLQKIIDIASNMNAVAIAIHLNALQEAIQPEGTPDFKGAFHALEKLASQSPIPIIVKETGSGMSAVTLQKLAKLTLLAVDVSGLGGTHWGRIEGARAPEKSVASRLGKTFEEWGVSTVESTLEAVQVFRRRTTEVWASGGVRTGVDAAKLLALGANRIGFAKPALQAALLGETALSLWMQSIEQELKIALFCTNSSQISELDSTKLKGL